MNSKIRSIISVILILCTALSLTACGGSAGDDTALPQEQSKDHAYVSETLISRENSREDAVAAEPAFASGDGYYAIGAFIGEELIPEGAVREYEHQFASHVPCISFVSADGSAAVLSGYSPVEPDIDGQGLRDFRVTNNIGALLPYGENELMCVENVYASWCQADKDVKYGTEDYFAAFQSVNQLYLRILDADGSELSSALMDVEDPDMLSFYNCCVDSAGNLLVSADIQLEAYGTDGQPAYTIPVDGYVYSLAATRDGQTAVMIFDLTSYTLSVSIVDPEAGGFTGDVYSAGANATSIIDGSGDYDLYANSGSSLFGLKFEDNSVEKLFSWLDCDIVGDRLYRVTSLEDGSLRGFLYSNETDNSNTLDMISVRKVPYDASAEKKTLTLATLYLDDNMMDSVIKFNRSHDDIRISVTDYNDYATDDDYSAGLTKLTTELAAGTVPDILDLSADLPYTRYAASGMLVDLYPYIDSDPDFSREDFFPNVLNALEVNGGLYAACPGFCVYTALGAASVIGDEPGLTYQQYADALASMPEGCSGFDVDIDKSSILTMSLALEQSRFIDWSTGRCSFDSPEFIKILEYCNTFPEKLSDDYQLTMDDTAEVRIAAGEQMLTQTILSSVNYIMNDYDRLFGGKVTVAGFPTEEGVGSMIYLPNGLAITSKCENRDAAWEFLRSFFSEEYQDSIYYLPVNRACFDRKLNDDMKEQYVTDANGNILLDSNGEKMRRPIGSYFDGVQSVDIYSITASQADMLRTAVSTAERLLNFDISINDIVTEGAAAYFAGQKSAEECAKLIQSKANLYVNEQK